ncbi:MAG: tRNA pseudouridine(38-40) synthase TruA [Gammaproteobacteria bacterium]|nr:tRNA pseudouridine(38-40) synthase TruA [Gammaproteobacteria bacterium]
MRVALGIQYDGSGFSGWQTQKHGVRTVQQTLEKSLSKVANEPIRLKCSGRTDTGVHGICQVVHFDSDANRDKKAWVMGGNRFLDLDVSVKWAMPVVEDFHARFSALRRRYRYVIINTPTRAAIFRKHLSWNYRPLDDSLMQEAANYLLGEHNFDAYRAAGCQAKSPIRTIELIEVKRHGNLITIDIQANAFLQHMVRNIAGVLMKIGAGDCPADWAQEVLLSQDRCQGAMTAAPYGLYFIGAGYPAHFGIPEIALPTHAIPSL